MSRDRIQQLLRRLGTWMWTRDDENEKESRSNNDRGGHGKIRRETADNAAVWRDTNVDSGISLQSHLSHQRVLIDSIASSIACVIVIIHLLVLPECKSTRQSHIMIYADFKVPWLWWAFILDRSSSSSSPSQNLRRISWH